MWFCMIWGWMSQAPLSVQSIEQNKFQSKIRISHIAGRIIACFFYWNGNKSIPSHANGRREIARSSRLIRSSMFNSSSSSDYGKRQVRVTRDAREWINAMCLSGLRAYIFLFFFLQIAGTERSNSDGSCRIILTFYPWLSTNSSHGKSRSCFVAAHDTQHWKAWSKLWSHANFSSISLFNDL